MSIGPSAARRAWRAVSGAALETPASLVGVCATCGRWRTPQGEWRETERPSSSEHDHALTHTLCPECMRRLCPELRE